MSNGKNLFEQMRTMTVEELENYYDTSSIAARFMQVLGIGLVFAALVFSQTPWVVLISIIGVLIVSRMSVGVDEIRAHVSDLLETKNKINS